MLSITDLSERMSRSGRRASSGHRASRRRHRPSANRPIPVRRLDTDLREADLPRWIVRGDPIMSHFVATLSAVFPRGEEFFVATVRDHRDAVPEDSILKSQVKAFIGQESMHGREHRKLNSRLDEFGYHTYRADARIDRTLRHVYRMRPALFPIAVTAAAEHLTGIFGEAALTSRTTRKTLFGDPEIQQLISWHALEELEHKNVAFDVLQAAGGGYLVRMAGFVGALGLLGGSVMRSWYEAMWLDRRYIGRKQLARHVEVMKHQKLLSPWAVRRLVQYVKPGFHPDDMDTDDIVVEWKERLASSTTVTAGMRSA